MNVKVFFWLCLAILGCRVHAGGITLQPTPGKVGPQKILVLVHGAYVNEEHYVEISRNIQRASSLRLWIGLPSFLLDTPNPAQITSAVKGMVDSITNAGNFSVDASKDVFVAGHSLGGVFAPSVVVSMNYAGLIEYGSYVTQGNSISTMKQPVLTLGGELDGLTRVTRIALEYQKMAALGQDGQWRKPVIVLPGVCHSQFCSGVNVSSFGVHDLVPDVSWEAAHEAISQVTASFLDIVINENQQDVTDAKDFLKPHLQYTHELVSGFLQSRAVETSTNITGADASWCVQAQQHLVAGSEAATVPFVEKVVKVTNGASLSLQHPSIETDDPQIQVNDISYAAYAINPIDVSTVTVAATSITCEMMSADAIALAAKVPGSGGKAIVPNFCQARNDAAISFAESAVTQTTLKRFQNVGRALSTSKDSVTTTGPSFLASSLGFDTDSTPVNVQGVSLATKTDAISFGGVYDCHLLSPAKVVEWMMVDGLPKLS